MGSWAAWVLAAAPAALPADLLEHVEQLASDELAGRETGSEGAHLAAEYIARTLQDAGVRPAGDDGTFFQSVPVVQWLSVGEPQLELLAGEEVLAHPDAEHFSARARRPLDAEPEVFVVAAPEDLPLPRSDLALFFDAPRSRWSGWLDDAGASGGAGYGLILYETRLAGGGRGRSPRPRWSLDGPPVGPINELVLREELAERFVAGEVERVRVDLKLRRHPLDARNVIGMVPGTDTASGEAIVVTAHYDHLAPREEPADPTEEDPDLVYNGADDNASGVSFVLELARAIAADPGERSVIFVLVTGEERGLLGMRHYVDHPVVPLAETVFNFNLEMVGRPDALAGGPGSLWLTGWQRTDLGSLLEEAEYGIVGDPRPEQNFYRRSDNYPLAVAGVVAQTFSSFGLHDDYHRTSDEVSTLDPEHMRAAFETCSAVLRHLADGEWTPQWLEGGRP